MTYSPHMWQWQTSVQRKKKNNKKSKAANWTHCMHSYEKWTRKKGMKKRHHTLIGDLNSNDLLWIEAGQMGQTAERLSDRRGRQTNSEKNYRRKKKKTYDDRQANRRKQRFFESISLDVHCKMCVEYSVAANASLASERTNQHISSETIPFPTNFSTRVLVGCVNSVSNYAHSPHKLSFSYTSAFFTLHFNELWFQEWSRYRCMLSISWLHCTPTVCIDSKIEKCHANSWAAETIYSFAWNLSAMSWVIKNGSTMCASESFWWIFQNQEHNAKQTQAHARKHSDSEFALGPMNFVLSALHIYFCCCFILIRYPLCMYIVDTSIRCNFVVE